MNKTIRFLTVGLATICLTLLTASIAAAAPKCVQATPTTMQCTTNGSTQIATSPQISYGPWGWGVWAGQGGGWAGGGGWGGLGGPGLGGFSVWQR